MEQIDPRHLLCAIARILDELDITYIVTGGMAVFVWGRPRFTADIDIVVELRGEDIPKLETALRALGRAGYIDQDTMKNALKEKGEFNFIDGETGVKVDFWVASDDPFSRAQLGRRIAKEVLGKTVYFISPEDLILRKLLWYTQAHSSRHLEDVESVFKISGDILDRKYLEQWADKLKVTKLMEEI